MKVNVLSALRDSWESGRYVSLRLNIGIKKNSQSSEADFLKKIAEALMTIVSQTKDSVCAYQFDYDFYKQKIGRQNANNLLRSFAHFARKSNDRFLILLEEDATTKDWPSPNAIDLAKTLCFDGVYNSVFPDKIDAASSEELEPNATKGVIYTVGDDCSFICFPALTYSEEWLKKYSLPLSSNNFSVLATLNANEINCQDCSIISLINDANQSFKLYRSILATKDFSLKVVSKISENITEKMLGKVYDTR
jgi:hypothetical protein